LIPSYLKDAHCALIVFDVTSAASMAETQMWVSLFNENKVGEGFVFLLANKIDLDYR
jgi:GTPase SAR1 family protein